MAANQIYAGGIIWEETSGTGTSQTRRNNLVFGARTLVTDIPTSGVSIYQLVADSELPKGRGLADSGAGATIAIDWVTRTVKGEGEFRTYPSNPAGNAGSSFPTLDPFKIDGTIDRTTGRLNGTVSIGPSQSFLGNFEGSLYGPRAAELGFVMLLRSEQNVLISGVALGQK